MSLISLWEGRKEGYRGKGKDSVVVTAARKEK